MLGVAARFMTRAWGGYDTAKIGLWPAIRPVNRQKRPALYWTIIVIDFLAALACALIAWRFLIEAIDR
jgi:hypothetical protein